MRGSGGPYEQARLPNRCLRLNQWPDGAPALCWSSRAAGRIVAVSRTSISGFLGRTRALLYQHEAKRAALLALAGVAAVCLVLPLLGHVVATRATALAVLGT